MPLWIASILLIAGMLLFISLGLKIGAILCAAGIVVIILYELFTLPKV